MSRTRDVILARRARFVAAALGMAGLTEGCRRETAEAQAPARPAATASASGDGAETMASRDRDQPEAAPPDESSSTVAADDELLPLEVSKRELPLRPAPSYVHLGSGPCEPPKRATPRAPAPSSSAAQPTILISAARRHRGRQPPLPPDQGRLARLREVGAGGVDLSRRAGCVSGGWRPSAGGRHPRATRSRAPTRGTRRAHPHGHVEPSPVEAHNRGGQR